MAIGIFANIDVQSKMGEHDKREAEHFFRSKSESEIFNLLADMLGNSDDYDQRNEWSDIKNDLDYDDLVDLVIETMENFHTSLDEIKDAMN